MTESTPTKNNHNYICVVWADAHAGAGHWAELEEHDMGEHLVTTVGMNITPKEGGKPEHITVAQSLSPDGFYDHVIYIPTGMVRTLCTLISVDDPQPESKSSKKPSSSQREAKKPKTGPSPSKGSASASSNHPSRLHELNAIYAPQRNHG